MYHHAERGMRLLTDLWMLLPVTAQDLNINGVLLGWAVMQGLPAFFYTESSLKERE